MIQQQLGLTESPNRIECYDISTNQGVDTVASMVVFKNGQPATSEYRRFKIKTVIGQDDFASMREVLNRRFKHLKQDDSLPSTLVKETDTAKAPSAWDEIPDLVIIDGGKGQLSVAIDVLRDLGRAEIPLCGLAKREEELFVKDFSEPILLPRDSEALYLVQRIRDEAHRFAITSDYGVNTRLNQSSIPFQVSAQNVRRP
jgi:excinuclease ABC subunit C